jgi:hypothetical protein
MLTFTKSEKKQIRKIKQDIFIPDKPYDFWLTYDDKEEAIGWEGGIDIYDPRKPQPTDDFSVSGNNKFRNEYRLYNNKITKNW